MATGSRVAPVHRRTSVALSLHAHEWSRKVIDLTVIEGPRLTSPEPVAPPAWSAWPLPGRAAAAEEIARLLDGPPGTGAVVLVAPRGVGRSAVARRVTALRDRDGVTTTWIVGTRYTRAVPFGALRHLLPPDVLPSDLQPPLLSAASPVADPGALVSAADALTTALGPDPVLVVDDLHLVDAASIDLLAGLVVDGALRMLATWPQDAGERDPLTEAAGSDLVAVRRLSPLDAAAVAVMVRRALDGDVAPDTATALTAACGGNPKRLSGLVTRAIARGTMHLVDGMWTWEGDAHAIPGAAAPGRITEPTAAALPADQALRRIVEVVAVADGSVGPEVVAAAAARLAGDETGTPGDPEGPDIADPADVDRAVALGLVRTVTSGLRRAVVLPGPDAAEAALDAMGRLRRRTVALALAAEVATYGGRRGSDVLSSALWRLDATGTAPREDLVQACDEATRAGDVAGLEALTWALLQGRPDPAAAARLASALLDHGRFAEATALLGAVPPDRGEGAVAADLALVRARLHGGSRQDHDRAVAELDTVPGLVTGLPDDLARPRTAATLEARVWHELWRAGPDAALAVAGSDVLTGAGPGSATLALALAGRSRSAVDTSPGHESGAVAAGLAGVIAACDDGWLDRAAALAAEAATEDAWSASPESRMWFAVVAGRVALRRGWAAAATSWYSEASALAEECGVPGGARLAAAGLAVAGAWHPAPRRGGARLAGSVTGDVAGGRAATAAGDPPIPRPRSAATPAVDVDQRGGLLLVAEPVLASAWQAARNGDLDVAHRRLAVGHRTAVERGALSDAAWIGYSYVRLGRADLAVACLEPLRHRVDGSLLHAWLDHANAAVGSDPEALALVGDRLAVCGAWLDAATALAQAAAVSRDPERGTGWRVQARDYLARCGAWRSAPDAGAVLARD